MIGSASRHAKYVIAFIAMYLAFGLLNSAFAVSYGELNTLRKQAKLPLLTGNDQTDFQMLAEECNRGIRYSCTLARQLQGKPKQASSRSQQEEEEAYCREQGQQAMFMGQFEAEMAYSNCILALSGRRLDQMRDESCLQLGIGCSSTQSGSSGGGSYSGSRGAICRGECVRKCSIMPSQEAKSECHAEERACQARCP